MKLHQINQNVYLNKFKYIFDFSNNGRNYLIKTALCNRKISTV